MSHSVGDIFWYRSKGKRYGGVILAFHENLDIYLIAISEELEQKNINIQDILNSRLYTMAWFDILSLLPPIRVHKIGSCTVEGDYVYRAGLFIDDNCVIIHNPGRSMTWTHQFRNYRLRDSFIKEVLNANHVQKTHI